MDMPDLDASSHPWSALPFATELCRFAGHHAWYHYLQSHKLFSFTATLFDGNEEPPSMRVMVASTKDKESQTTQPFPIPHFGSYFTNHAIYDSGNLKAQ
jgi:hypothetical protein